MEINAKEKARLEKIAKQNDVKGGYPTLKKMWDEKVQELTDQGIEENIGRFAVHAVSNEFRRQKARQLALTRPGRAKATALIGFIVGDMGLRDRAGEMRRDAKRYAEKNGVEAAMDAQLINGDGEVLDQRVKVYGKENPNHLKPLVDKKGRPLRLRSRVIFCFFRKNGEKKYRFTAFQSSDNKIAKAWDNIKFFKPCQTFGIIKEEDGIDMRVNSSQAEGTVSVFQALNEEVDITKVITDTLKNQFTKIQKVEKHYEGLKDAWDRRIFLRGVVAWINTDRPTPWGAVYMGLMDPEDEEATIRVLIPEHLAIDFGELSEVIVFGRSKRGKYRDEEGKLVPGDVRVDAFGIYPIPGLTTPVDSGEAEALEDEEEIEGWLPL